MDYRSYSLCLTAFAAVAVMRVPAVTVVFPEGDTVVSDQKSIRPVKCCRLDRERK